MSEGPGYLIGIEGARSILVGRGQAVPVELAGGLEAEVAPELLKEGDRIRIQYQSVDAPEELVRQALMTNDTYRSSHEYLHMPDSEISRFCYWLTIGAASRIEEVRKEGLEQRIRQGELTPEEIKQISDHVYTTLNAYEDASALKAESTIQGWIRNRNIVLPRNAGTVLKALQHYHPALAEMQHEWDEKGEIRQKYAFWNQSSRLIRSNIRQNIGKPSHKERKEPEPMECWDADAYRELYDHVIQNLGDKVTTETRTVTVKSVRQLKREGDSSWKSEASLEWRIGKPEPKEIDYQTVLDNRKLAGMCIYQILMSNLVDTYFTEAEARAYQRYVNEKAKRKMLATGGEHASEILTLVYAIATFKQDLFTDAIISEAFPDAYPYYPDVRKEVREEMLKGPQNICSVLKEENWGAIIRGKIMKGDFDAVRLSTPDEISTAKLPKGILKDLIRIYSAYTRMLPEEWMHAKQRIFKGKTFKFDREKINWAVDNLTCIEQMSLPTPSKRMLTLGGQPIRSEVPVALNLAALYSTLNGVYRTRTVYLNQLRSFLQHHGLSEDVLQAYDINAFELGDHLNIWNPAVKEDPARKLFNLMEKHADESTAPETFRKGIKKMKKLRRAQKRPNKRKIKQK